MNSEKAIDLSNIIIAQAPFPNFRSTAVFAPPIVSELYGWLNNTDAWELTETEFYEQYEFSLLHIPLPTTLTCLIENNLVNSIKTKLESVFKTKVLNLVGITVHKLTDGQHIGVHNDFIGKDESHRFLVQINSNWTEGNGGYLLLFNSDNAEDISDIILPISNSGFGFEISEKSNHAVSTVYNFSRYTLVYTFN